MKPNLFISYSRREVSFVNNLVDDLEDDGFNVWLDYRNLVPGTPWAAQIDRGIFESEVILLVVSKASMASKNVEVEWRRVLKENKRVILLIFEAVDLPHELESYEWVDFRGSYKKGLKELIEQVQAPVQEERPAPETGFKMPKTVWLAVALSLAVAVFSLGAFWTLFIPYLLLTLPYRIFKRDFNYVQVLAALVMLPFALFLTSLYVESDQAFNLVLDMLMACLPFVIALFFVLRSPAMQRWGKPVATRPVFANLYVPDNPHPQPVSFYIDHAPQDRAPARDLSTTLEAYGHPQAASPAEAEAVFVLVSRYKKDTQADPEKKVVYPVILQTTDGVTQKLEKVQWIDFRYGFRNLDAMAQLLPEPARLLKALGIRPMGNQQILPPIILYLVYFIVALMVVTLGSWLPFLAQFAPDIRDYSDADTGLLMLVLNLILFVALAIFMVRVITARHERWAFQRRMILAMLILGALILWQLVISGTVLDAFGVTDSETDFRGLSAYFPPVIYGIGNFLMILFVLLKRADMRRWFLAKK